VDQEEVAFDILSVQEIHRMVDITPVPKAPPFVEGVINLRGRIVPVLNLRRRLGVAGGERTAQSRIVVVNLHGRTVGLVVDTVSEVLRIPHALIEAPPALGEAPGAEFVKGVSRLQDRLLILLDLHRLLAPDDRASAEPVRA
jgi:purine-binding chemotaxis protein CheW